MAAEWCDGFMSLVKSGQPIVGESTDIDYPEAIEILSFKFGSMSGFADTGEFFAVQQVGDRHGVAMTRAYQSDESEGLSSLFASDEEIDQFQGKDLSDVEACNFQIVKEMDISSPDLFRAYCSAADLENRDVFDSATVTLRKATGKTRACVFDLRLQRPRRGGLFARNRWRRLAKRDHQPFLRQGPRNSGRKRRPAHWASSSKAAGISSNAPRGEGRGEGLGARG